MKEEMISVSNRLTLSLPLLHARNELHEQPKWASLNADDGEDYHHVPGELKRITYLQMEQIPLFDTVEIQTLVFKVQHFKNPSPPGINI